MNGRLLKLQKLCPVKYRYELHRLIELYGLDGITFCRFCERPSHNVDFVCDFCWEPTTRLEAFLRDGGDKALAFVTEVVKKFSLERETRSTLPDNSGAMNDQDASENSETPEAALTAPEPVAVADPVATASETTAEPEPETPDDNRPPAWFGPAIIRAMKADFLKHIGDCAVCRGAREVDEVCDEGRHWVDALGLDKPVKAPEQSPGKVTLTREAAAKRIEGIKRKASTLQERIDNLNDQIRGLKNKKDDESKEYDAEIAKLKTCKMQQYSKARSLADRNEEHTVSIRELKEEIAGLEGEIAKNNQLRQDSLRELAIIENDLRRLHRERGEIAEANRPKIEQLEAQKTKLVRRLTHHKKLHAKVFSSEGQS